MIIQSRYLQDISLSQSLMDASYQSVLGEADVSPGVSPTVPFLSRIGPPSSGVARTSFFTVDRRFIAASQAAATIAIVSFAPGLWRVNGSWQLVVAIDENDTDDLLSFLILGVDNNFATLRRTTSLSPILFFDFDMLIITQADMRWFQRATGVGQVLDSRISLQCSRVF